MKMMQKSLLALAVLASTAMSVHAASNVDVKVIGNIDPGTCTPTLSGGGTVDYGTMSPSVLDATGYTVLPVKELDFTITCTAASKVAVYAVNNRANSVPGGSDAVAGGGTTTPSGVTLLGYPAGAGIKSAGLGLMGTTKVGGYMLGIKKAGLTADSNSVDQVFRASAASNWSAFTGDYSAMFNSSSTPYQYSFSSTGQTAPVAFTNLSGKLGLQAFVNKRSELDLTNKVNLDGSATLELVYLP